MTDAGSGRARFAQVVRAADVDLGLACLLIGAEADPSYDVDAGLAALDDLAGSVAAADSGEPAAAAEALRAVLGGFSGTGEDYLRLESSLLPHVLRTRRGLPILLSVVWLEVARRAGIPAYGVGLPGHFVVAVGEPGGAVRHVDPFRGGAPLGRDDLARIVGEAGTALHPEHLAPWDAPQILLRVLTNIRAWAGGHPERGRTRLWAVELALLLPRHPVELRREHGEQLVRVGRFAEGAAELEAYAAVVEPVAADVAETALREARSARARLN